MDLSEIAPFSRLPEIKVRALPSDHEFHFLSGKRGEVIGIGPLTFHRPISVVIWGYRGEAFAFPPSELEIMTDEVDKETLMAHFL